MEGVEQILLARERIVGGGRVGAAMRRRRFVARRRFGWRRR
jgi:hypothetical protein